MKIVVGLGNPGERYAKTRHNVGWMVVDRLADRAGWDGRGRERDASRIVQGRFRALDLTLVKPLTFMNESGLAVRKVLAREHAPLVDLLVVADDFALPFGKLRFREGGGAGGHNGLGSIIDELQTEKFSRLRVGIGDPQRNAVDHVLSTFAPDERQRLDELLDAAADAIEAWARDGTNKAANRFNSFQLRAGRHGSPGGPGRGRRATRSRRRPPDEDGLAPDPAGEGREGRQAVTTPPLRGKRGAERRVGEQVAEEFARRHGRGTGVAEEVDFDVAEVDREVEDARRSEAGARARAERAGTGAGTAASAKGAATTGAGAPKGGRRLPDLSVLPPLLAATGSFASLRERLGTAGTAPARIGRHAGLTSVPHGAKRFLAAALALGETGERLVWVARDAEIGDRVAEELGAWLGDPDAVVVLEPRTALAYERSELVADETAARVAALSAWRTGRARILVASVQALLQRTLDPDDLPAEPRVLKTGARVGLDALLHELLDLGYQPAMEVAGRGEFARRGGIVDVFPPGESLPVRVEFFGDEIDSLRRFDPTDQRTVGPAKTATLLPASEFLVPRAGSGALRERSRPGGGPAPRAARRRPRPLRGGWLGWRGGDDPSRGGPRFGRGGKGRRDRAHGCTPGRSRTCLCRHPGPRRRRRGRGLGRGPLPGHRAGPRRPRHAPRPRRAGRPRRVGDVPVAPGRRAAGGARGRGRPAEGLAGHLPPAARLEGPPARRPDPRADLGVGGVRGDRRRRAELGRPLRLARAERARVSDPGA